MSAEFWDEMYRSRDPDWVLEPNRHLVREASSLPAGYALDAGSGEGDDAIWLAERGWHVTAVDISAVAQQRSAAHADSIGAAVAERIVWLTADLTVWTPQRTYDLVSAQFMQLAPEPRARVFRALAAAVAPGGALLVVGHHPTDLQTTMRRPPSPELLYTASDIEALLERGAWDVELNESPERSAIDPDGHTVTIRDSVLFARRRRAGAA